ncbi:MAG: hypothetical protein COB36_11640 [Alphaproteobacteria bacterium]|nr:MAG: hypothetical protein COB36_11640 [Alphaproteobacteria bacterium]
MGLEYAKNFLGQYTVSDNTAHSIVVDRFGQAYAMEVGAFDSDVQYVVKQDGTLIGSRTKKQFNDDGTNGIAAIYPAVTSANLNVWTQGILADGKYLLIVLDQLTISPSTNKTYYTLLECQENAMPTLVHSFWHNGLVPQSGCKLWSSNTGTDDDPICMGTAGYLNGIFYVRPMPSINEFIAGSLAAGWWALFTGSPAPEVGEFPRASIDLPVTNGHNTELWFAGGRTTNYVQGNDDVFILPNSNNVYWYLPKGGILEQLASSSFRNAWIFNDVAPTNAQALAIVEIGTVSASIYGAVGTGRGGQNIDALSVSYDNTIIAPALTDDNTKIIDGSAGDSTYFCPVPQTYNGKTYLPFILVSWHLDDNTSVPAETLVQLVRIHMYEWDGSNLVDKAQNEGVIFTVGEFGNLGQVDIGADLFTKWDIKNITTDLTSTGELIVIGITGNRANSQQQKTVFFTSFGVFSDKRRVSSQLL